MIRHDPFRVSSFEYEDNLSSYNGVSENISRAFVANRSLPTINRPSWRTWALVNLRVKSRSAKNSISIKAISESGKQRMTFAQSLLPIQGSSIYLCANHFVISLSFCGLNSLTNDDRHEEKSRRAEQMMDLKYSYRLVGDRRGHKATRNRHTI